MMVFLYGAFTSASRLSFIAVSAGAAERKGEFATSQLKLRQSDYALILNRVRLLFYPRLLLHGVHGAFASSDPSSFFLQFSYFYSIFNHHIPYTSNRQLNYQRRRFLQDSKAIISYLLLWPTLTYSDFRNGRPPHHHLPPSGLLHTPFHPLPFPPPHLCDRRTRFETR